MAKSPRSTVRAQGAELAPALLPEKSRKPPRRRETIMVHAATGRTAADGLHPRTLQRLCFRLFNAEREGHSAQELTAIIDASESYL